MNQLSTIAEAVVTALDDAALSLTPASVERVYVPSYDATATDDLKVFVVGLEEVIEPQNGTREAALFTYGVKVAIYKGGVTFDNVSSIDALSNYREEVCDLFRSNELADAPDARLTGISIAPVYDPALLETKGVFASVITLNYRLLR